MACECITKVDQDLRPRNTALITTLFAQPDRVVLCTDQVEKGRGKKKATAVIATFCPFCGRAYDETSIDAGADQIAKERQRQISGEGYSPANDDGYVDGDLAWAAWCYLSAPLDQIREAPTEWPWDADWWKPTFGAHDLVRAGALIAAELTRRKRAHDAFLALVVEACVAGGADRDYAETEVANSLPDFLKAEGIEVGHPDRDWGVSGAAELADELVLRHLERGG